MNLNHLEYMVSVSQYGSISKAAQNLFVSQPYLSGMIKGLEKELGYEIFHRTSAGIELTDKGKQFIKSAKLILLEMKKIRELKEDETTKRLNISCYYATYIMEMFLKFRNISPLNLSDKIKEMGNKEVMESVLSGDSTLGIIFYAKEKERQYKKQAEEMGLCIHELFPEMPMYVIMSEDHALANREELTLQELQNYAYVSYDDTSSKKYLKLLGIEGHKQLLEVSDRGSFYDALLSGEYISVMAFKKVPQEKKMVLVPFVDKNLFLKSSYVTGANHKLTKREKEFLDFIRCGSNHSKNRQ